MRFTGDLTQTLKRRQVGGADVVKVAKPVRTVLLRSSLGGPLTRLCGITDVGIPSSKRRPTAQRPLSSSDPRVVKGRPEGVGHVPHALVSSATMESTERGCHYHVTAWKPAGRPAFVFLLTVGEQRYVQPPVPEGADFDEVMLNVAGFVRSLLPPLA